MTAIFGCLDLGACGNHELSCKAMGAALRNYGPHKVDTRTLGPLTFGRRLFRLLPEDVFDAQPLVGGDGRLLLVADVRLDNRAEIARGLNLPFAKAKQLSDAEFLLRAWEAWEERVFDRLVGDYAFAIWDARHERLVLARDPLGERPLHYHLGGGFLAFASMPQGLFALDQIQRRPNLARVAAFILNHPRGDGATYFDGIEKVPPGHYLSLIAGEIRLTRHWNPSPKELRLPAQQDYIEAFREQLNEAVRCRLRGSQGVVATHLSAGLDSNAVAATAARLLAPDQGHIHAFTSAPRKGFDGRVPRGRIADESGLAAVTASHYPNMEHTVLRSDDTSMFSLFDQNFEYFQEPATNVCNNVWWSAINSEISRRGIRVLLGGGAGNLTLNAGNLNVLADLVKQGNWRRWWRECRLLARNGRVSWRGVLAMSFGAWVSPEVWHLISQLFLGSSKAPDSAFLVRDEWLAVPLVAERQQRPTGQPASDSYALRMMLLRQMDTGNVRKGTLARWGIDERDPTSDIRVINFSLSLPREQLVRDGIIRPLSRAALSDRVPQVILNSPLRGYQYADWYEHLDRESLLAEFDAVAQSPSASSVISLAGLRKLIETWPEEGWQSLGTIADYRVRMMLAFSGAHFLRRASGE